MYTRHIVLDECPIHSPATRTPMSGWKNKIHDTEDSIKHYNIEGTGTERGARCAEGNR